MDKGEEIDYHNGEFTIHECASVLKAYLGKLDEPLVTEKLYSAHLEVARLSENSKSQEEKTDVLKKQIFCLQLLIELIPEENFRLLKDLMFLLHGVSQREVDNKMSSSNLGTMFSTHIFCPKSISAEQLQAQSALLGKAATFLIENPIPIFTVPEQLIAEVKSVQFRRNSRGRVSLVKKTSQGGLGVASLIAGAAFSFNEKGELSATSEKYIETDQNQCALNEPSHLNPEDEEALESDRKTKHEKLESITISDQ